MLATRGAAGNGGEGQRPNGDERGKRKEGCDKRFKRPSGFWARRRKLMMRRMLTARRHRERKQKLLNEIQRLRRLNQQLQQQLVTNQLIHLHLLLDNQKLNQEVTMLTEQNRQLKERIRHLEQENRDLATINRILRILREENLRRLKMRMRKGLGPGPAG